MRWPELTAGRLVRRENRFRVTVQLADGPVAAHLANSGRLGELLIPGCAVWLSAANAPGRKTGYDLALVEHHSGLVSVDARLPNLLFAQELAPQWLGASTRIQPEVQHGASRFDFRLAAEANVAWVEVKSCTLVREGVALFPDAPTARGARHLRELAEIAQVGERADVVFVVQRSDAVAFRAHHEADPALAEALTAARRAGVGVHAYGCAVDRERISIARELPVLWDAR